MNSAGFLTSKRIADATLAWKALNGIFLIYKSSGQHFLQARQTVQLKLSNELNRMQVRPPMHYVDIKGDTTKNLKIEVRPMYGDHPLVVGPRYPQEDIRISAANILHEDCSGLMVFGINDGTKNIAKMKRSAPTRYYKVKGLLGEATDNYFKTGKVVEKSTYKHVKRSIIDNICASMQSAHQSKMFEICGVDIQSQAAYELALKGPLRPADNKIPMIYSIKCLDFTPPDFTLEIVCINENHMYLKEIIHELGIRLNTNATCTQIHCFQYGIFTINHALIQRDWTVPNILNNISICKQLIAENRYLLQQDSPTLVEPSVYPQ